MRQFHKKLAAYEVYSLQLMLYTKFITYCFYLLLSSSI